VTGNDRREAARRSLKRKVAVRKPRKTLLVICEGTRTEPDYLRALKQQPTVRDVAAVDLRVETGKGKTNAGSLVSIAVAARNIAIDAEGEIDEFWCVFDVEWPVNQPGLNQAVEQANQHDIHVAISNPCFELWLILHFQDQNSWLSSNDACKLRARLDGSKGKGLSAGLYMPRAADAAIRAKALDNRHRANDSRFPRDNPSSGMHFLLTSIQPTQPEESGHTEAVLP
jgi:hypothetical protein